MKKPIVIIGAGGLGREILSLLKVMPEWEPVGFLDDNLKKTIVVDGLEVIGPIDEAKELLLSNSAAVIAVGDPQVKAAIAKRLEFVTLHFPSLIHPSAILMNRNTITMGSGAVIGAGAILTTGISVGKFVLLNINSSIGHDCEIGNFTSIMPGVNLAGGVKIGEEVLIGSGANVLNGIRIGDRSKIGMGSVVLRDIAAGSTAVGVPAKMTKSI